MKSHAHLRSKSDVNLDLKSVIAPGYGAACDFKRANPGG